MNIPNETKERLNQIYGTKGIWDDGIEAVFAGSKYATVSFEDVPSRIKFVHLWNNRVVRSKHEKHATAFDIMDIVAEYPKTVEYLMERYSRYFEHRFININDNKKAFELVVWVDNSCQSNKAALGKPFVQIDELSMGNSQKHYLITKQSCPDLRVRDPYRKNGDVLGPKYMFDDGIRDVFAGSTHAMIEFDTYPDMIYFMHIWNSKVAEHLEFDVFDICGIAKSYPKTVKYLVDLRDRFFKANVIYPGSAIGKNSIALEVFFYDRSQSTATRPEPVVWHADYSRKILSDAVDILCNTQGLEKIKVVVSEALAKQIKNGEEKSMSFMYSYQNLYPKKIHFSGPCTIAIWPDGTKTIVRIKDGDMSINDPEKAIAMVCLKKFMGGHNFRKLFKDYMPEEEKEPEVCDGVAPEEVDLDSIDPFSLLHDSDLGGAETVQNINLEE